MISFFVFEGKWPTLPPAGGVETSQEFYSNPSSSNLNQRLQLNPSSQYSASMVDAGVYFQVTCIKKAFKKAQNLRQRLT